CSRSGLRKRGSEVRVTVDEAATVAVVFDSRGVSKSAKALVLARVKRTLPPGQVKLKLKLSSKARKQLRRKSRSVRARILVSARDAAGNESTAVKSVIVGRRS